MDTLSPRGGLPGYVRFLGPP